ncbi:MAG: hypothetical protein A2W05_01160 [Candidatus Schekmanbacteria bacterium RBG_16_38_10]|uniref:Wzt C-terminal domain-containing protein n=1 Tax=Candidatus Schekmanbacteria bacterium RBG_16_38_10 TaxID=1817879 RepID=A0A1F7RYD3_9BACT|nr:MAG: hypothetical protein A2W05_01160 [Candidatus Schekmanbacteria bacterium RBG_16_38_10]
MAEIVDFKVYNHEGIETMSLETGQKFRVWMKIEFYDEVKNPAVGIMIRNPQGQNLLGIHSYHERRMNFGEKREGDVLCVSLESVMILNPDNYTLSLGIADVESDYDFKSIDVRNNVAVIPVYGKQVFFGLIDNPGRIIIENS